MKISLKNVLFDLFWVGSFFWIFGAFINTYFSILEAKFNSFEYYSLLNEGPRLSISILLVLFPIFFAASYYRKKYLAKNKDISENPKSKYSIYLIDLILVITFVSTFITIIYKLLGGEVTNLFLLKCLTIFFMTVVSGVYFYVIDKTLVYRKAIVVSVATLSSISLMLAVVLYVNVFGSPQYMRNVRADEEKLNTISMIESSINYYYTQTKSLPKDLGFSKQDTAGIDYKIVDKENYQLCAEFKENRDLKDSYSKSMNHDSGYYCYQRNVFNY